MEIKGGAKIFTELRPFSLIVNILHSKKTGSVSCFLYKLKIVGKMKRSSFNVLFFLKKTKLLKNGEASVCIKFHEK